MGRKKTDEREWLEDLLKALPETPDRKTVVFAQQLEEINPPLIIYARESVPVEDFYLMTVFGSEDAGERHWGAECRCTACGDDFYTGWMDGKIAVTMMEDGNILEGWTKGDDYETVLFGEGQEMPCPRCGTQARVIKRRDIRGRTYRTRIAELTNVEDTTVIIYWFAERYLSKQGYSRAELYPSQAVALSPAGRLLRFGWDWGTGWNRRTTMKDPESMPFNGGGDMWNRFTGAYLFNNAGSMEGATGEKAGIDAYFGDRDACRAAGYLRIWQQHPTVEALVKTGGAAMMADYVDWREINADIPETGALNLNERKPHRIAGLKKDEYRFITKERWKLSLLAQFHAYRKIWPKTTVEEFNEWAHFLNSHKIEEFRQYYPDGLGRICRYIEKAGDQVNAGCYLDYRRMLTSVRTLSGITRQMTQEEKFPPDLIEAHDRMMNAEIAIRNEQKAKGTPEQIKTFASLKKKYAPVEWKCGEFCIVIPESPADLVREGTILHHCVGGYAASHCDGRMIFFVRHAKRPERSWYTLNEDVTGTGVRRIQLHGYKNEMVKGKTIKIPKEVTDFVQRWEQEILAPYLKNKGRISA